LPLALVAAAGLLIGSGWAVARGYGDALIVVWAVGALSVLAIEHRGAACGLLLLAAANGLPFVNSSHLAISQVRVQDLAILTLIGLAVGWVASDAPRDRPGRLARVLVHLGAGLTLWWTFTLVRSVVASGVSATQAAGFARDFLYFGVLLMVLPRVRFEPRDIRALVIVVGLGTCAFAIGQLLTSAGLGSFRWLVHALTTRQVLGVNRVYAQMLDLVVAGFAVAAAASLLATRKATRIAAGVSAVLLGAALGVELGRAYYVGLGCGLALAVGWLLIRHHGRMSRVLRRRLGALAALLVIALVLLLVVAPHSVLQGGFIHRLISGLTDLQSSGGTVGERETLITNLTGILGGKWPIGLGFLPPSAHYVVGLRGGSIRQSDVGVFGAIMTMGAIGAALIYLPVIVVLAAYLRRSERWLARGGWLQLGATVWMVAVLVTSPTLITLYSASGLTLTAVILSILVQPELLAATDKGIRQPTVPDSGLPALVPPDFPAQPAPAGHR
jgi:hypothetical protein